MKLLVFSLLVLTALVEFAAAKNVVCYWGTWANYRPGDGQFVAEDVDANLCTHVIYTFTLLQEDGTVVLADSWLDVDLKMMERLNGLKLSHPNLKTLLAVGGWNEGSVKYSNAAADPAKRARFVSSAVQLVKTYGFDGFDIDWEYPAQREGSPDDKVNYIELLRAFRAEFNTQNLLLSAALAAFPAEESYNVPEVFKNVDLVTVMAYDFHGSFDGKTGANAPLYKQSTDPDGDFTVDNSVRSWLQAGADPNKINLGVPLYGHTFTLDDPSNTGFGSPSTNPGTAGPYTRQDGTLGYNEICLDINNGWTKLYDENTRTPYAFKGNQWLSYDNEQSLGDKVQLAIDNNLGGISVWSIETDDFKGRCGAPYPLLNSIKNRLN